MVDVFLVGLVMGDCWLVIIVVVVVAKEFSLSVFS